MQITMVEEQKKNKNRVSVYIDGEFSFGMNKEDAYLNNITEGRDLSAGEYAEIMDNIVLSDAKNRAVKYLSYAPRTTKEVITKLKEFDFSKETIKEVLVFLRKHNYINDKAYTEDYVEDRQKKGYGLNRIKNELRLKGIKAELIESTCAELESDPIDIICELLKKRIKSSTRKGFYEKERQKIYNYLSQRGFKYDDAKRAVDRYWDGQEDKELN